MFNLIRRISSGVIPRPDRPWEDDATSNAPARRKKRRLSSTERELRDDEDEEARKKKARGDSDTPDGDSEVTRETPVEAQGVKEVTQGVKEVDLGADSKGFEETKEGADAVEGSSKEKDDAVLPESIPLPDEETGELDAPEEGASPSVSNSLEPSAKEAEGVTVNAVSKPDVSESSDPEDDKESQSAGAESTSVAPVVGSEPKQQATATIAAE